MNSALEKSNYHPDIQGLRAVAVLLVVFYHAGFEFLSGGYIGVDVFFVISGYLITGLLLRELTRSNGINIADFYARRIRRLLPTATVVLISTVGVAWTVYAPLELKQFLSSAFATAVYLSNIWFAHLSTDYLAEDTDANPLLHTWSLSAEEQFYLFWPFLIIFLARKKSPAILRKHLLIGILIVCIASLFSAIFLTYYNQSLAFFISPTRAWEFGLGGLIALWIPKEDFPITLIQLLGFLGLVLIFLASYYFNEQTRFPGFAAIVPVIGACFIIIASHRIASHRIASHRIASHLSFMIPSFANKFLSIKPLQFVGNISYSLYLWHWPIFVFMTLIIKDVGLVERVVAILVAFILSWVTFTLIENPFRFSKPLINRAYVSILFGFIITVFSASLALSTRELAASSIKSEVQQRYLAASQDIPKIYSGNARCHADFFQTSIPECVFGDQSSQFTVVLFGDSHAAQWFPALEKIAVSKGLRLLSLTKTGCPSIIFEPYEKKLGRFYSECGEWRERVFDRIKTIRPRITIIANSRKYINTDDHDKIQLWRNGVINTIQRISKFSGSVVIIRDTPWLDFSAPICLSRANWQGNDHSLKCTLKKITDNPDLIFDIESTELSKIDQGIMLDMTKTICPNSPCLVERDGLILYHDSNHLTASFSLNIADQLMEKLQPILPR